MIGFLINGGNRIYFLTSNLQLTPQIQYQLRLDMEKFLTSCMFHRKQ